jgi:hypothetical protein
MSNEWDHLTNIGRMINNDLYEELEEYVVKNKKELATSTLTDALTMLPIDRELMIKHQNLYKTFIEISEETNENFGLRSAIRYEAIKTIINKPSE